MQINMGYCRFQNTLAALRECEEWLIENEWKLGELGDDEEKAAKRLLRLCRRLGDDYEED